jgi:uncharacterized membrane protein
MSVDTAPAPVRDTLSAARSPAELRTPAWTHAANAVLGAWLATAAATYSPHPPALLWSDVASGVLIVVLSGLACSPRFPWAAWAVGCIGLWLMSAPLVFWAPTAAAYGTGTLVGTLVIVFALLVPGTPGTRDLPGPDAPPGWSYNPSAWPQRAGIIALAFVQFFAARYLAAHQLEHVPHAWDPFFADGTYRVLNSDVSKSFPVSDAGLGAVTYLMEALTGFLGGTRRWRTSPWAVLLFGVLIVPVGVVSIVLVVLQPLAVGAWCSLCLLTAVLTVFMISPAVDELVATCQFLLRARREGRPFWAAFWVGGTDEQSAGEERPRPRQPLLQELAGGMELNAIPWNLAVCAVLGVWLMAAPAVLGSTGAAAGNDQLAGALVVTFAVIGFGEASRAVRWINIPLGAWLLAAPWVLSGASPPAQWSTAAVGAAVILLSLRRGPVHSRFGSWDRFVF